MNQSFGMMDTGYFVGKVEVLQWVNDLLKLSVEKIEQLGSGAAFCQILDVIFPGELPVSKINWNAQIEYEYLNNFKLLTNLFAQKNIQKHVQVNKLVKCKYQDNLEFAQWLKKFFQVNCGDRSQDYDAVARRGKSGQNSSTNSGSSSNNHHPTVTASVTTPSTASTTNSLATQQQVTTSSTGASLKLNSKTTTNVSTTSSNPTSTFSSGLLAQIPSTNSTTGTLTNNSNKGPAQVGLSNNTVGSSTNATAIVGKRKIGDLYRDKSKPALDDKENNINQSNTNPQTQGKDANLLKNVVNDQKQMETLEDNTQLQQSNIFQSHISDLLDRFKEIIASDTTSSEDQVRDLRILLNMSGCGVTETDISSQIESKIETGTVVDNLNSGHENLQSSLDGVEVTDLLMSKQTVNTMPDVIRFNERFTNSMENEKFQFSYDSQVQGVPNSFDENNQPYNENSEFGLSDDTIVKDSVCSSIIFKNNENNQMINLDVKN